MEQYLATDWVAEKKESVFGNIVKDERRSACKVEGQVAWRNIKDKGFRP